MVYAVVQRAPRTAPLPRVGLMVIGLVVAISMVAPLALLRCNVNGVCKVQASAAGMAAGVTSDIKAYDELLHQRIFRLPGVDSVHTSVVLREVKDEVSLPL